MADMLSFAQAGMALGVLGNSGAIDYLIKMRRIKLAEPGFVTKDSVVAELHRRLTGGWEARRGIPDARSKIRIWRDAYEQFTGNTPLSQNGWCVAGDINHQAHGPKNPECRPACAFHTINKVVSPQADAVAEDLTREGAMERLANAYLTLDTGYAKLRAAHAQQGEQLKTLVVGFEQALADKDKRILDLESQVSEFDAKPKSRAFTTSERDALLRTGLFKAEELRI